MAYVGTNTAQGSGGTNEEQAVTLTNCDGGNFTLTFDGQTTVNILYNAAAATVATALKGLSNIGDSDVSVSGSAGGPYTVTFIGSLADTNVPEMTATDVDLTGTGHSVAVSTTTEGSNNPWVSETKLTDRYDAVAGTVFSDISGTLTVEQSSDGTNWDLTSNTSVTGNTGTSFNVNLVTSHWRLKFDWVGTQTAFRIHGRAIAAGDS